MCYFITCILFSYNTISKIALYPALSYYLFFCANIGNMFPVRQTVAAAIGLTSIYFIYKKKKLAFLCIVLLAVSFHNSMLIWLIAYPIYHKNLKGHTVIFLFCIAAICGLIGKSFFVTIVETIFVKNGYSGPIAHRLIGYTLGNYSDGSFSWAKTFISIVKRLIFFPFFLFFRPQLVRTSRFIPGLLNLYFAGNIIYMLFVFHEAFSPLLRMTTPFLFTEVLIIPPIIATHKDAYSRYIILMILLMYGLMKLTTALTAYPAAYMPYRSIFN